MEVLGVSERRACKVLGQSRSTQWYEPAASDDELLDREIFYTLQEVQVLTEQYRQTYNGIRPHSSLGYRPPAPEAILVGDPAPALVGLT